MQVYTIKTRFIQFSFGIHPLAAAQLNINNTNPTSVLSFFTFHFEKNHLFEFPQNNL